MVSAHMPEYNRGLDLVEQNSKFCKRVSNLVLVGFGFSEDRKKQLEGSIYPDSGLRIMRLPSWQKNDVNQLITNLKI
ncbi:MAG TPA: hypothetical protein VJB63_00630 [Patescibacteria group bacterium]|nr:hypothetical protein [Patescibacteria group bacterium]